MTVADQTDADVLNAAAAALLADAMSSDEGRQRFRTLAPVDQEVVLAAASDHRERMHRLDAAARFEDVDET